MFMQARRIHRSRVERCGRLTLLLCDICGSKGLAEHAAEKPDLIGAHTGEFPDERARERYRLCRRHDRAPLSSRSSTIGSGTLVSVIGRPSVCPRTGLSRAHAAGCRLR
jgi:hypothetical protein